MIKTKSATEIWLIGNPKSDLNTSCLSTNGDACVIGYCIYFCYIFKNQNATTNDDVKHRWASQCKTLASLTTSPLTNFTPPLTLISYFQL